MNTRWFSVIFLGAALASGCAAAEDGAGRELEVLSSVYRVPVPDDLEAWATYPVPSTELDREGGAFKIEYTFPTWLVGDVQQVELVGTYAEGATSFPVSAGIHGSGECLVTGAHIACTEVLPGIAVNRAEAQAQMQAAGLSAHEVSQRLRVTDAFSVDPIGIIEFDLPGSGSGSAGDANEGEGAIPSAGTGAGGDVCPASMPEEGSYCESIDIECAYGGDCECECEDEGVWECKKC